MTPLSAPDKNASSVPAPAQARYHARQVIHALISQAQDDATILDDLLQGVERWSKLTEKTQETYVQLVNAELAQFYWVSLQRTADEKSRSLWCQSMWVAICRSPAATQQVWMKKFHAISENLSKKSHADRLNVFHPWPRWKDLEHETHLIAQVKTPQQRSFWDRLVLGNVAAAVSPNPNRSSRQSRM